MFSALVTEAFGARAERADADVKPRTEIGPDNLYLQQSGMKTRRGKKEGFAGATEVRH